MEDKSYLVRVFGEHPEVKVLDFLLTFRDYDYSLSDIAKNSNVGWTTLHQFFPKLVKQGIVKETRRIGRAKLYKLDTNSELVKNLIKTDDAITKFFIEKEIEKGKLKYEITARAK